MAAKQTSRFPDVSILKQFAQSELIHSLESMPGEKDLVIDPDLLRPMDNFIGFSKLKEHGVKSVFKLTPDQSQPGNCTQRIYLVRPIMKLIKLIADQINKEKGINEYRTYKILMLPRKLHSCVKLIESEGVMGEVEIEDLSINMFVVDTDLITLELPHFFRSFYLEGDITGLHTIAESLLGMQQLFGRIPNVYRIGAAANNVHEIMKYLETVKEETQMAKDVQIGHMFIIDREVDFMTPLCSQVTYEGMLDESFGIDNGVMDFKTDDGENVRLVLSSKDETYAQARDKHFTTVFQFLKSKTQQLQAAYDKRHGMSIGEMKTFVGDDLPVLNSQKKIINHHIHASEIMLKKKNKSDFKEILATERSIMEMADLKETIPYIEETIHRQFSYITTLRLLCLLSLTYDGIPTREYKSLKTQFLHSHGFEHMLTWHNLKKVGLLKEKVTPTQTASITSLVMSKKSPYLTLSKKLNLVPNTEVNLTHPTDMSYVFGGAYTPLSCSLVENGLLKPGYVGLEDIIRLPGQINVQMSSTNALVPRVVLVCFIGGCTYAETSALRFLSLKLGYQFIVVTTSMINGSSIVESLIERFNV